LPTIRAYDVVDRFVEDNFDRVDRNARASFYFEACARWLGMRLDFVVAIMVTLTCELSFQSDWKARSLFLTLIVV